MKVMEGKLELCGGVFARGWDVLECDFCFSFFLEDVWQMIVIRTANCRESCR